MEEKQSVKKGYVYMLRCEDGSLYTGITTDPARRWKEHREGRRGAKYTKAHRIEEPVLLFETEDLKVAAKYEYRIKKLEKGRKEELVLHPDLLGRFFPKLYEDHPALPLDPSDPPRG